MTNFSQPRAASVLKHHGVIAHQTDTIFGLACLPDATTLTRLSQIKLRPKEKTFILLASDLSQLSQYIDINNSEHKRLCETFETPTTWLVKPAKRICPQLIGETNKVAIRITTFNPVDTLCQEVGAIASTSANISNHPACNNPQQIRNIFGPSIDYIDPSQMPGTGKSSTIIDLSSGKIIRR